MHSPPYLAKGDKIGIAATARKISDQELQSAIDFFTNSGYEIVLSDTIFEQDRQFAGSDGARVKGFQQLLDDQEVKAILCARGGYGTVRIVDQLKWENFLKFPKWIAGYSDVTVLHAHLQQNLYVESIHSAMPIDFNHDRGHLRASKSLLQALEGEPLSVNFPAHDLNRSGSAEAELVGGNLSILYSLNGSSTQIDTRNKILFIEDLDEYLYHLDRMMMNLKRAGMLESIKGLIVGSMSDMKDNTIPFGATAEEIILDAVKDYDFPVCFGFPAGHAMDQQSLILGRRVRLEVKKSAVNTLYFS